MHQLSVNEEGQGTVTSQSFEQRENLRSQSQPNLISFLESVKLEEYFEAFRKAGASTTLDLAGLSSQKLLNKIGLSLLEQRRFQYGLDELAFAGGSSGGSGEGSFRDGSFRSGGESFRSVDGSFRSSSVQSEGSFADSSFRSSSGDGSFRTGGSFRAGDGSFRSGSFRTDSFQSGSGDSFQSGSSLRSGSFRSGSFRVADDGADSSRRGAEALSHWNGGGRSSRSRLDLLSDSINSVGSNSGFRSSSWKFRSALKSLRAPARQPSQSMKDSLQLLKSRTERTLADLHAKEDDAAAVATRLHSLNSQSLDLQKTLKGKLAAAGLRAPSFEKDPGSAAEAEKDPSPDASDTASMLHVLGFQQNRRWSITSQTPEEDNGVQGTGTLVNDGDGSNGGNRRNSDV